MQLFGYYNVDFFYKAQHMFSYIDDVKVKIF